MRLPLPALALLTALLAFACSPAPDAPQKDPVDDTDDEKPKDEDPKDPHPPDLCGFEQTALPLAHACNADRECDSGLCLRGVWANYCTVACDPAGAPCPDGFACDDPGDGTFVCTTGTYLPGDGSLGAGAPCNADEDCAGGAVCGRLSNDDGTTETFCAPPCTAEGEGCGDCGTCQDYGGGYFFCDPAGSGRIGDKCRARHDCASFTCLGFCTQPCGGAANLECHDDAECLPVDDARWTCVQPEQRGGTAAGLSCTFDFECEPGTRCLSPEPGGQAKCTVPAGSGSVCTGTGECAEGLFCRGLSETVALCSRFCDDGCGADACVALDLDTDLRLFDRPDADRSDYIERNDDIDAPAGDQWSEIRGFDAVPGVSYAVSVSAYRPFTGTYRLEILTGSGTPREIDEQPGAHASAALAHEVGALPVAVSGRLSVDGEADYYAFTVSAPARLTLRTGRGAPSACLPASVVGTKALGEACDYNQACASSLCLGRFGICGEDCAGSGECGTGFFCGDMDTRFACVPDALAGTRTLGESCEHSFECDREGSFCAVRNHDHFCAMKCGEGTPGCTLGWECAPLAAVRHGETVTEWTCVAEGRKDRAQGQSCELNTDCVDGLHCPAGVCAPRP